MHQLSLLVNDSVIAEAAFCISVDAGLSVAVLTLVFYSGLGNSFSLTWCVFKGLQVNMQGKCSVFTDTEPAGVGNVILNRIHCTYSSNWCTTFYIYIYT